MATPAQRQPVNIRLSLQKAIADRVQTPNTTPAGRAYASGWIDYDDDRFENSGFNEWARVEMVSEGAGSWDPTLFQVTCFTRESSDHLKVELERMIDLFLDAMRTDGGYVQIYDFAVPASPVAVTGKFLLIQNSRDRFGEAESGPVAAVPPDGTSGKVITWRCLVSPDDYTRDAQRSYSRS